MLRRLTSRSVDYPCSSRIPVQERPLTSKVPLKTEPCRVSDSLVGGANLVLGQK